MAGAGEIDGQEWRGTRTRLLHRIQEEQDIKPEQVYLERETCIEPPDDMVQVWEQPSIPGLQQIVRSRFKNIIYGLDEQRIVNFQLNP